jgi:hypothetical protein
MNFYGYPPTNKHTWASYIALYDCNVNLAEQLYSIGNPIANFFYFPRHQEDHGLWLSEA